MKDGKKTAEPFHLPCRFWDREKVALVLERIHYSDRKTALGGIFVAKRREAVCRVDIGRDEGDFVEELSKRGGEPISSKKMLREEFRQLEEYLAGKRRRFSLPLDMRGTTFQLRVWRALLGIPYGETRSYAQVARIVKRPKAHRAVGNAVAANPIPIIIPCHRVISSNGDVGGYSCGVHIKRKLLRIEGLNL